MSKFRSGNRVRIVGYGAEMYSTIIEVRLDSSGDPIYTLQLDDPTQTPEGIFYVREGEILPIGQYAGDMRESGGLRND